MIQGPLRSARRPYAPVFVGGTGRSGTTVLGELIGRHSHYALIPLEVRFHIDRGGLADLLVGDAEIEHFRRKMRNKWYDHRNSARVRKGLHRIASRSEIIDRVDAFALAFPGDPWGAARSLMREVLDPVAHAAGKPSWVEMTPATVARADVLSRVFPEARFVHVVRDGRDAAASVVRRPWGPDRLDEALDWWAARLAAADAATQGLDGSRLLVVRLEDLLALRRRSTYQRLLWFLRIRDEPAMRRAFDEELSAGRGNLGRWRTEVPADERDHFDARYRRTLASLAAAGVRSLPVAPDAVDALPAPGPVSAT